MILQSSGMCLPSTSVAFKNSLKDKNYHFHSFICVECETFEVFRKVLKPWGGGGGGYRGWAALRLSVCPDLQTFCSVKYRRGLGGTYRWKNSNYPTHNPVFQR